MKTSIHIWHSLRLLIAVACFVSAASLMAQPADRPGGPGRGGPGGRGGPPSLSPEEMTAITNFNASLATETLAVTVASSNLVAATYSTPKDATKIVVANVALSKAREAWATRASTLFANAQASTNKLSEAAIAHLVATAPGGRGIRGGPGGGRGPGGPGGGPGPGGPPRQQ